MKPKASQRISFFPEEKEGASGVGPRDLQASRAQGHVRTLQGAGLTRLSSASGG